MTERKSEINFHDYTMWREVIMTFKNSPRRCTSTDLELEVIKRFRDLAPLLSPECRVYRELSGRSIVLCLDFAACTQDL